MVGGVVGEGIFVSHGGKEGKEGIVEYRRRQKSPSGSVRVALGKRGKVKCYLLQYPQQTKRRMRYDDEEKQKRPDDA